MGDENPRIMYGVIITVYVDHREMSTTIRSFKRRENDEEGGERFIERIWKRGGNDRRASLLAYIREMRAENESVVGDLKSEDGVVESVIESERFNPKKKKKRKRKWIRKMMSTFRIPFLRQYRRRNGPWRYCQLDPDEEEEAKSKSLYNSDIWKTLKHMVGRLSRGCTKK